MQYCPTKRKNLKEEIMSDKHNKPGPQNTGSHKGGVAERNKSTGSVHYTDFNKGKHTSWDEDSRGNVSRVHTTEHSPKSISQNPTDNYGNPK